MGIMACRCRSRLRVPDVGLEKSTSSYATSSQATALTWLLLVAPANEGVTALVDLGRYLSRTMVIQMTRHKAPMAMKVVKNQRSTLEDELSAVTADVVDSIGKDG